MAKVKLFVVFLSFLFLVAANAQPSSTGVFVMYAPAEYPTQFTHLSELDGTGTSVLRSVFQPAQKFVLHQHKGAALTSAISFSDTMLTPFGGSVASIAYDKRSNRVYYFPTYSSELRYLDLSTPTPAFTYLNNQSLNLIRNRQDVANQISRMTIDPAGWGYALSNDAEHLIRFSTQGKPSIMDLGSLSDLSSNSVFVKSSCTSWGGDMVMDQDGRLILITQSNYVFKIDIDTRVATYVGQLQGLPNGFTTNGAAVTQNGELLLSSSASRTLQLSHHIYKVADLSTLQAEPVMAQSLADVGNISDMASSFMLGEKRTVAAVTPSTPKVSSNPAPSYTLYPNPVTRGRFNLRVQAAPMTGEYDVIIMDISGRVVQTEKMLVAAKSTTKGITLPSQLSGGVYVLKLVDYFKRTVFSTQFIVE